MWAVKRLPLAPTLLLLLSLLLLSSGAAQQAAPAPAPTPSSTSTGTDTGIVFDQQRMARLNDVITGLPGQAQNTILRSKNFAENQLTKFLFPHAESVFIALFFPIFLAEVAFTGIRIAMRAPIIDQLANLVINTAILIIIFTRIPLSVIDFAKDNLQQSGRAMGASIVLMTNNYLPNALLSDPPTTPNASGSTNLVEPISYWFDWLGVSDLTKANQAPDQPNKYKYSPWFISARVFGDPNIVQEVKAGLGGANGLANQFANSLGAAGGSMMDFMRIGALSFMPFYVISFAIYVAGTQLAGFAAVIFGTMSILVAAHFAYAVTYALGFAVVPLLYFRSFSKIWAQYLTYLTALALVPFFYYLFSAIGYAFSALVFELFFPGPKNGQEYGHIGALFEGIFLFAIDMVVRTMSPITNSMGMQSFLLSMARGIGILGAGSTVVTTFITGGVAFAGLSIGAAFRWNQAFASEEMLARINDFFLGFQSALGSSIGQAYGMGIERLSGAGSGLTRMLGGRF